MAARYCVVIGGTMLARRRHPSGDVGVAKPDYLEQQYRHLIKRAL